VYKKCDLVILLFYLFLTFKYIFDVHFIKAYFNGITKIRDNFQ